MKPNLIYYKLLIYIIHKTIILLINSKTSNISSGGKIRQTERGAIEAIVEATMRREAST